MPLTRLLLLDNQTHVSHVTCLVSLFLYFLYKIAELDREGLKVEDRTFSHEIDYVIYIKEILNLKGHPNCITGLTVTTSLLNGWILPVCGVASGRVSACSLHSMLVFVQFGGNRIIKH